MNDYRDTAEMLFNEGYNVIPVNADKTPHFSLKGTNYLYEIQSVFDERYISHMIAMTCGVASDGVEVLDFDCHNGENIASIFEDFMSDQIIVNLATNFKLAIYSTPSGGYHVIFKSRYFDNSKVLARYESEEVMIETRGAGSYAIIEPTPNYTHQSGADLFKLEAIDRDERNYIINLAASYNKAEIKSKSKGTGVWGDWDESKPWGKFNTNHSEEAKQLLTDAGWYMVSVRHDGTELWRRPGKNRGISATFGQFKNMFYCFTSSASPFEPMQAYSPTDVMMHLKFDGDWNATRKYLTDRFKPKPQTIEQAETGSDGFPIDVFPEAIQEYIIELNKALNYKEDFLAVAFMFAVATMNGNKYKLRVKNGWVSATTFWFAVVGESGVMKTHPVNAMIKPLKDIDKKEKRKFDGEMSLYTSDEKSSNKPQFKQIMIEDFTLEAGHYIHKNNPRGLGLHKDELIGFLNDMNKYRKGSDEQFWLESFNNSSYIVNRVTKDPLMIDNIMINIIGGIQPQLLHDVAGQANGNGLIERFLYTTSESNIYPLSLNDIRQEWIDWYDNSMKHINDYMTYEGESECTILEMEKQALQKLIDIDKVLCDMQMSDDETTGMKNYINKIKTYVPRFALLVCIIDAMFDPIPLEVTVEHMKKAERLAQYFTSSARYIFSEGERKDEINAVKRSLNQRGMTKAEQIIQLSAKGFKQVDISRALSTPASYVSKVLKDNE
jgi:hypothetical protein